MAASAGAGGGQGVVDSTRAWLDKWAAETPPLMKGLSLGSVSCYALGLAVGPAAVATVPLFVLRKYEVYRLVVSPLFEHSVISLLIVLLWLNRSGVRLERELGLRRTAVVMAQVAVSINVLFCAVMVALSQAAGAMHLMVYACMGLFPTILALLVVVPPRGPVSIMFLPIQIPPEYLPHAIVVISALFSGGIPFDLVCALGVGYFFKRVAPTLPAGVPLPQYAAVPTSEQAPSSNIHSLSSGRQLGSAAPAPAPALSASSPLVTPRAPFYASAFSTLGGGEANSAAAATERERARLAMLEAAEARIQSERKQPRAGNLGPKAPGPSGQ